MPNVGAPGKEQFRDAIVTYRNRAITIGIRPLVVLAEELVNNDEFSDRGGADSVTQRHFQQLLHSADLKRRLVTYNPDGGDLGELLVMSSDPNQQLADQEKPFDGESIQAAAMGLTTLPIAIDGSDVNLPLLSALNMRNGVGLDIYGAVCEAIVCWTRLESRNRSWQLTRTDSLRVYQVYRVINGMICRLLGDANRVDVASPRATDEPRGPAAAANRLTESNAGVSTTLQ